MARSTGVKCHCGEVQFTVMEGFVTKEGNKRDIIMCDSCGQDYAKPEGFQDNNKGCLE